jgi:hypothetical protein
MNLGLGLGLDDIIVANDDDNSDDIFETVAIVLFVAPPDLN